MKKIESLRANGKITPSILIELGSDPELEHYIIVCKWKDGGFSAGWSDMLDTDLTFGMNLLNHAVNEDIFGDS